MSAIADILSALIAQGAEAEGKALLLLMEYLETIERTPQSEWPSPESLSAVRDVVEAHTYNLSALNARDWHALVERLDALIASR